MTPEFSRPERLDAIGEVAREVAVAADDGERRRLAARFALVAVDALEGAFALRRSAAGVLAEGRVTARVTQACAVSGAPVEAAIDEPVSLRFVADAPVDEEVELDADAIDTIVAQGGAIDLGELAAETMALALDPFPRAPDAETALGEASVADTSEASPFAALAALKGKLV